MSQYQSQSDYLLSPGGNNNNNNLDESPSGTHTPYSDIVTKEESNSGGGHYANGGAGAAAAAESGGNPAYKTNRGMARWKWLLIGLLIVAVIVAAVVGGVVGSQNSNSNSNSSRHGERATTDPGEDDMAESGIGCDGAIVTMEDGTTFRYNNSYGGYFTTQPFNMSARVRADVKSLSEEWDWSTDLIQGVNLGGWLVLEPFITPAIFEEFEDTVEDEYTLSERLGDGLAERMEEHYSTFITERDIAQIAGAGLNFVRIPVPFWAIETVEGEPYLEGVAWKYFLKAAEWCRKYGLRIELDMHTVPGSQNGLNHSGRLGTVGWMHGVMGIVNAQRTLNYVRTITEFVSQPEYRDLILIYMPVNEPMAYSLGQTELQSFYKETYETIRGITGVGKGNGPLIAFHDGFLGLGDWDGFMAGADRVGYETHPYLAFAVDYFDDSSYRDSITRPCQWWAPQYNSTMQSTGLAWTGEFCLAINDCGEYVNDVGKGSVYDGTLNGTDTGATVYGDCRPFVDYENYSDEFKNEMKQAALAYMDMSRNWFFWTWKTGANSTGHIPNPQWSFKLGLDNGWMPTDYGEISGACTYLAQELGQQGPEQVDWEPPLQAWMTGGDGAGDITASTDSFAAFPPTSLSGIQEPTNLPTLTPTGTPITLSLPTVSGSTMTGDGWFNTQDTTYFASIAGCDYLEPYSGVDAPEPTAPCSGSTGGQRRMAARGVYATPAPTLIN